MLHPRLLSSPWTKSEPAAAAAFEDGVCLSLAAGIALGHAIDFAMVTACLGSAGAGLPDEAFRGGPEPFFRDLGGAEVGLQAGLSADVACRSRTAERVLPDALGAETDLAAAAGTGVLAAFLTVGGPIPAEELEGLAARLALLALLLGLPSEAAAALPAVLNFESKPLPAFLCFGF